MTLNQFVDWVNENRDRLSGDETLAVAASGGLGGHGHAVESVYLGFDWDNGKLMFSTKTPLTIDSKAMERLKKARAARKEGAK